MKLIESSLILSSSHKSSILTKTLFGNICWCLLIVTRVNNYNSKSCLKTKICLLYAEISGNSLIIEKTSLKTRQLCRKKYKKFLKPVLDSILTYTQPPHFLKVSTVSVYEMQQNQNLYWAQKGLISISRLVLLQLLTRPFSLTPLCYFYPIF
jgi:hypothetical protein